MVWRGGEHPGLHEILSLSKLLLCLATLFLSCHSLPNCFSLCFFFFKRLSLNLRSSIQPLNPSNTRVTSGPHEPTYLEGFLHCPPRLLILCPHRFSHCPVTTLGSEQQFWCVYPTFDTDSEVLCCQLRLLPSPHQDFWPHSLPSFLLLTSWFCLSLFNCVPSRQRLTPTPFYPFVA